MWRLVHQWSFLSFWLSFDCFWLFDDWYTVATNSVPIVTGLPRLYQQCTNRQKQSKTVKRQSKQQKWRLVYQSSHVYIESTEYTKPLQKVAHGLFKQPTTGPLKSKMAEIRHLGSWFQNAKTRFSQKLSNLKLWCLLTTYRKLCKLNWAFQRTHYWIPKIQDGWDTHRKNRHDVIFCADGSEIWIKFRRLVQNDMSTAVMCGNGNKM